MSLQSGTPGPAAYSVGSIGNSGPKYGFKGKSQAQTGSAAPGPGAYNPSVDRGTKAKGPDWSFGKSNRGQRASVSDIPGPSMYNPSLNRTAPLGSFGTAKRGVSEVTASPGPGAYSVGGGRNSKAGFSISSRHTAGAVDKTKVPGPGAYTPQNAKSSAHMASFGTSQRQPFRPTTAPGPGAYDPGLQKSKSGSS